MVCVPRSGQTTHSLQINDTCRKWKAHGACERLTLRKRKKQKCKKVINVKYGLFICLFWF